MKCNFYKVFRLKGDENYMLMLKLNVYKMVVWKGIYLF